MDGLQCSYDMEHWPMSLDNFTLMKSDGGKRGNGRARVHVTQKNMEAEWHEQVWNSLVAWCSQFLGRKMKDMNSFEAMHWYIEEYCHSSLDPSHFKMIKNHADSLSRTIMAKAMGACHHTQWKNQVQVNYSCLCKCHRSELSSNDFP